MSFYGLARGYAAAGYAVVLVPCEPGCFKSWDVTERRAWRAATHDEPSVRAAFLIVLAVEARESARDAGMVLTT